MAKGLLNPGFPGKPNVPNGNTTKNQTFAPYTLPGQVKTAAYGMSGGPQNEGLKPHAKLGVKKAKVKKQGRMGAYPETRK